MHVLSVLHHQEPGFAAGVPVINIFPRLQEQKPISFLSVDSPMWMGA
jgi:hypothetical protein